VRPNEWTEEASDDRCIIILFITQAKILVVNDWHPAKNHACEEKQPQGIVSSSIILLFFFF